MTLPEFVRTVLQKFEETGLPYLLAGGFALGMYVAPRATEDLDIVLVDVKIDHKLYHELRQVFPSVYVNSEHIEFAHVDIARVLIIDKDGDFILDILTLKNTGFAKSVLQRKKRFPYGEIEISVISAEDLYLLKKSSGRTRDAADCEELEKLLGLDAAYIEKWKEKLRIIN